jgi:cytochrome c oxidase subunit 3
MNSFFITNLSKARNYPNTYHLYHILSVSPWPILTSIFLFSMAIAIGNWFKNSGLILTIDVISVNQSILESFIIIIFILYYWWKDVCTESGEHTNEVVSGIKIGMVFFIISEVLFFFSFFWAYMHFSINPSIEIGLMWPPLGIKKLIINPYFIPLLNTFLLLGSGIYVTLSHKMLNLYFKLEILFKLFLLDVQNNIVTDVEQVQKITGKIETIDVLLSEKIFERYNSIDKRYKGLAVFVITLLLAILFTLIQLYEYIGASFNISDSVYGSSFFMMTGFHGLHVIIGTIFLTVCFIRIVNIRIINRESTGLECSIWYWHFVDVVWLLLFGLIYWWGFYKGSFINSNEIKKTSVSATSNVSTSNTNDDNNGNTEEINVSIDDSNGECFELFGVIRGYSTPGQKNFQDPATVIMNFIIDLHNQVMFYSIIILTIVIIIMGFMVRRRIYPNFDWLDKCYVIDRPNANNTPTFLVQMTQIDETDGEKYNIPPFTYYTPRKEKRNNEIREIKRKFCLQSDNVLIFPHFEEALKNKVVKKK